MLALLNKENQDYIFYVLTPKYEYETNITLEHTTYEVFPMNYLLDNDIQHTFLKLIYGGTHGHRGIFQKDDRDADQRGDVLRLRSEILELNGTIKEKTNALEERARENKLLDLDKKEKQKEIDNLKHDNANNQKPSSDMTLHADVKNGESPVIMSGRVDFGAASAGGDAKHSQPLCVQVSNNLGASGADGCAGEQPVGGSVMAGDDNRQSLPDNSGAPGADGRAGEQPVSGSADVDSGAAGAGGAVVSQLPPSA